MTAQFTSGELLTGTLLNAAFGTKADIDPATGKLSAAQSPAALAAATAAIAALAAASGAPLGTATLDANGKVQMTELPYIAGTGITISTGGVIASTASAGGSGLTPPTAAQMSFWHRQAEASSYGLGGLSGGPSTLTDTAAGLEVCLQTRTNDVFVARLFGVPAPSGPWELVMAVRPSDVSYTPFWMGGPCAFRSTSSTGVWSKYIIGRDQPLCYTAVGAEAFATDSLSGDKETTLQTSTRSFFLQRVYHRMVYDAAGFVTVFISPISKTGPWRFLYSSKMDAALGAAGTGAAPDYVTVGMNALQESPRPIPQYSLVEHWDLHAYTGAAQPII